jgi:hypothetical protein
LSETENMPVFRNEGQLFEETRFEAIKETPEWTADEIDEVRLQLEELLEKREPNIEEGLNALETQYYWVSPVLRAMGYTFSVAELSPDSDVRPDFTLFYNADDFRQAVPRRGEREFFAQSLAVLRCYPWDQELDDIQLPDGPGDPGYEVDRMIRSTGVNWGILTNGRVWRLYHRESSGLMSTYYEVDLLTALQSPEPDEFKYFWTVFSPEGLGGYDNQDPLTLRILN